MCKWNVTEIKTETKTEHVCSLFVLVKYSLYLTTKLTLNLSMDFYISVFSGKSLKFGPIRSEKARYSMLLVITLCYLRRNVCCEIIDQLKLKLLKKLLLLTETKCHLNCCYSEFTYG